MEISAENMADITEIYHAIQVEQANLNSTESGGPNAVAGEFKAAERLLCELIPHYRKITPSEVQDYLNLDLAGLEKTCRTSLNLR